MKKVVFRLDREEIQDFLSLCKKIGLPPSRGVALAVNSYRSYLQKMAEVANLVGKDE